MDIDKIQKIIESCHINFLIGSGASKDYLDTLWNIEILLTELDNETEKDKDWYEILETSIRYWYFDKCIRGNLKLINDDFKLPKEKEEQYKDTFKNYEDFISALNVILLKRKTNLINKQVNIFTTNMDVFIDKVLDKLGVEFNDGFSGKFKAEFNTSNYQKSVYKSSAQYDINSELPLFNLFKLHGSLTWVRNEDKVFYDSSLKILLELDKIKFDKDDLIELTTVVDKVVNYKTYEELKSEAETILSFANYETFKTAYDKLVMINPTKEKFENTTLRLEYYEQMRMYSNILEKENSVLFVSGFSFADEHIQKITLRALNSNPTLLIYVFCFNDKDKENIDGLFSNLKFSNLHTSFVGYNFNRTIIEIFEVIAKKLDSKFYGLKEENERTNQENEKNEQKPGQ